MASDSMCKLLSRSRKVSRPWFLHRIRSSRSRWNRRGPWNAPPTGIRNRSGRRGIVLLRVHFLQILKHVGEVGGQTRVQIHHFADVAVELPNERHVPSQALGNLGLVVQVDLVDEQAVVVKKELHLSGDVAKHGRHSPVQVRSLVASFPVHLRRCVCSTAMRGLLQTLATTNGTEFTPINESRSAASVSNEVETRTRRS